MHTAYNNLIRLYFDTESTYLSPSPFNSLIKDQQTFEKKK